MWNLFNDPKTNLFLDGKTATYLGMALQRACTISLGGRLEERNRFSHHSAVALGETLLLLARRHIIRGWRCWIVTNDREGGVTPTKEKPTYMIVSGNMTPPSSHQRDEFRNTKWSRVLEWRAWEQTVGGALPRLGTRTSHLQVPHTKTARWAYIVNVAPYSSRNAVPVTFPLHPRLSPPVDASTAWQFE